MKRKWRELSDQQKKQLSQSAKGKRKSFEHRRHISQAMKDYWKNVPHMPDHEAAENKDEKPNKQNGLW